MAKTELRAKSGGKTVWSPAEEQEMAKYCHVNLWDG